MRCLFYFPGIQSHLVYLVTDLKYALIDKAGQIFFIDEDFIKTMKYLPANYNDPASKKLIESREWYNQRIEDEKKGKKISEDKAGNKPDKKDSKPAGLDNKDKKEPVKEKAPVKPKIQPKKKESKPKSKSKSKK